jgi:hypothetical protein
MKNKLARISAPLGLSFILAHPVTAQEQVNFGRSPSFNVLATPSLDKNEFQFSESVGFNCPTTNLSFGGFGTGGNDWSNEYSTDRSAGSGINNFGIAAGIRVPLAGSSAQNCKEYSKVLLEKARIGLEGARRNDQIAFLRQCHWLIVNKFNFELNKDAFSVDKSGKEGPFSSLNACTSFKWKPPSSRDGLNTEEMRKNNSLTTPVPFSPVPRPIQPNIQRNI